MDINSVFGKELSSEEIRKIVTERYEKLEEETKGIEEISSFDNKIYQGYIPSKTEVIPSLLAGHGVRIDDSSIYESLILRLSKLSANVNLDATPWVLNQVQSTIDDYFGTGHNSRAERNFYMNDADNISIKDFKKKNIAICHERAATANNLLAFLGYDSTLVMSKINGQAHAFNVLVDGNGKRLLFDPMNPIIFEHKNGVGYIAAMSILNEEEYNDVLNHNEYTFNYKLTNFLLKSFENLKMRYAPRIYGNKEKPVSENVEI